MGKFNLKRFLTEDGCEFILCRICRYNRQGTCLKANSMANSESPSETYINICKGFASEGYPIKPSEFAEMMNDVVGSDDDDNVRYMMEYFMCVTLTQLGYGDGAKIFLDQGFELPFHFRGKKKRGRNKEHLGEDASRH